MGFPVQKTHTGCWENTRKACKTRVGREWFTTEIFGMPVALGMTLRAGCPNCCFVLKSRLGIPVARDITLRAGCPVALFKNTGLGYLWRVISCFLFRESGFGHLASGITLWTGYPAALFGNSGLGCYAVVLLCHRQYLINSWTYLLFLFLKR